jgi:RNA polymerase sigma-70 factor (ECF subfamily)
MIKIFRNYQSLSDETLMLNIKGQDDKAFEELYRRYSELLLFYFFRMLGGNAAMAKDFLQELFLKIIEQPEKFNTHLKFKTWIYTIAHNLCKNEYRKQAVRNKNTESLYPGTENHTLPDDILDQKLFNNALEKALESLSFEQKSIFVLRHQKHLSIREIKKVTGLPEGTIKSRLYYAIQKLADQLKEYNLKE